MAGVFISHASADNALVGPFVDDLIRLGCGVPPEKVFYSSGEDTGVPSGENLNTYVRDRVTNASIVVAIISPTFQTRPYCVAELGVAWGRIGDLFPIAVPGMARTDLEGVLEGMAVRHIDDPVALDELHSRVSKVLDHTTDASTWGRYKAKWLASVASYVANLPTVRVATIAELERTENELAGTREALTASEAERRTLADQLAQLAEVKTSAEVAEILLPKDEVERFQHIRSEAADAVNKLDRIVGEAMWYDLFENGMPLPNRYEDELRHGWANEAKRDGTLIENQFGLLKPDDDVTAVRNAYDAVKRLRQMLEGETHEQFDIWFREQYGVGPDLRKKLLWDKLLG